LSSSLKVFALLGLSGLSACGFTPLYGHAGDASVAGRLDLVRVGNIPDRPGQMLRLALESSLHAAGRPVAEDYVLNVSYGIAQSAIGIEADTSSTRTRFTGTAGFTLAPIGDPQRILDQGSVTAEDALNVIDQQYFASTLETDTVNQQLADEISAQITEQLAAYFKTQP
ncbi:MAG: hypothetical protein POH28_15675, partial [Acidocella sp.]|nr:hypothetical protein [Acidocella sp.]